MAWSIEEHLVHGEIENRTRGRVTGALWFLGRSEPVRLDLRGDCAPDLAGCTLAFENPEPRAGLRDEIAADQRGHVGIITASQRVKDLDCSIDEFLRTDNKSWHWANALCLEWFSIRNGRVVIQTTKYKLRVSAPAWTMTDEEYRISRQASAADYLADMEKMYGPLTGDARFIDLNELLREDDGGEGEEWKKAE
ncbi:MAG: hypothetical protein K8R23_19675 [Chthoniobacter sp.]|nr:hypothetical protein [Chthoniobacter sp.]